MNTETTQYETPSPEEFRFSEKETWEMAMKGVIEYEDERRMEAIRQLFKKESLDYQFREMSWYWKAFYWLKCFICLGFELTDGHYLRDSIEILTWNERQGYESVSWDCVWVETGVFKNWKVFVGTDGT